MLTRNPLFWTSVSLALLASASVAIAIQSSTSSAHSNSATMERVAQPQGADFGQMLFDGLNETEGCLKVLGAQTSDGTNTIIAWFENKAAAKRWYYSETHTRMMRLAGSDPSEKEPMAHVHDEDIPIMVMASIIMGGENVIPGPMPISQISIELYTPLDAGASINGRLMPDEIELEHFNSIEIGPEDG